MDPFLEIRRKPLLHRRPDLIVHVTRAEVTQDNQLVLELLRPVNDVIQVRVAELVDLLLPVLRPEKASSR